MSDVGHSDRELQNKLLLTSRSKQQTKFKPDKGTTYVKPRMVKLIGLLLIEGRINRLSANESAEDL